MTFRFQGFPVYTDIRKFISDIYRFTSKFPQEERYGLASQIRNAAISISLNLAEGSDRGSDREFNRFVRISIGSVNEVVAALDIAYDNKYIQISERDNLIKQAESIVKQLGGFSRELKKCKSQVKSRQSSVVSCKL